MIRRGSPDFSLALLLLLSALLCAAESVDVRGRVVDSQTSEPISRARVEVTYLESGHAVQAAVLTNADGTFLLTNVPEGASLRLNAQKAGYLGQGQTVGAARSAAPVMLQLTAQVVIEGDVVDASGSVVPFPVIILLRESVIHGRRGLGVLRREGADDSGAFRIFGLDAGRYYVAAIPRVQGGPRSRLLTWPPVFFPSSMDSLGAQRLDLSAGQEQRVQIRLPAPVATHEIRGEVVSAGELRSLQVFAPSGVREVAPTYEHTWDEKTKTFRISGLPSGTYVVEAQVQQGPDVLRAGATVQIMNADVAGVRLQPASTALSGTMRMGTEPVEGYLTLESSQLTDDAPTNKDGTFQIPSAMPGQYWISVPVHGSCIQSVRQGLRDARQNGVLVSEDSAPEPVDVVLGKRCGSVEGTVPVGDGKSPSIIVALLRQTPSGLVMEKQVTVNAAGSSSASFALPDVTPGDYSLYAWSQGLPVEYADQGYMQRFDSEKKSVKVEGDGKVTVTIEKVIVKVE